MKQAEQINYLAPELHIVEVVVEQGFAGSLEDPEYDGEL